MSRFVYPHTIDNRVGERLIFLRRVPTAGGDRREVENAVAPGAGSPMHVQYHQAEVLTVQRGRIGYQRVGQPAAFARAGETLVFMPGDARRF